MEPSLSLPSDIIFEILTYLPVKPLLKFKCVCKTWCSLISSPQFTKAHLKISKNSKNYVNHRVMLLSPKQAYITFTCSLSSILGNTAPVHLSTWPVIPAWNTRIYGSCNGLLCVEGVNSTLVLYNPTTRKSKTLPALKTDWGSYYTSSVSYGIFYHELDDDYRVVVVRDFWGSNYGHVTVVNFYSSRTNSWRKSNDDFHWPASSHTSFSPGPGTLVDGVLHWALNDFVTEQSQIFAVNTITYTYQILSGPKYDNSLRDASTVSGIMDFGGFLGVWHCYLRTRVDIMVMKESWTKVVSVSCNQYPWKSIVPLIGFKDGEILMGYELGYIVYKSREMTFVKQDIEGLCVSYRGSSPVYIESLVDPTYDGGKSK